MHQNSQVLLFFVPNWWFFYFLDCDDCNLSCTSTASVCFDFITEYASKLCIYYDSCVGVCQVEWILFFTFTKVVEFLTVCVGNAWYSVVFCCVLIGKFRMNHDTKQYVNMILVVNKQLQHLYKMVFDLHVSLFEVNNDDISKFHPFKLQKNNMIDAYHTRTHHDQNLVHVVCFIRKQTIKEL